MTEIKHFGLREKIKWILYQCVWNENSAINMWERFVSLTVSLTEWKKKSRKDKTQKMDVICLYKKNENIFIRLMAMRLKSLCFGLNRSYFKSIRYK